MDKTIQILDRHIENNLQVEKQQKLNSYKLQILYIKESLEKVDVQELVESWFSILNKRHIAFFSIIHNKNLYNYIKNLDKAEQLNKR